MPIKELAQGQNILLVPPDDPKALADAVVMLYQNPELRARLSQGARELSKEFGWEGIARDTLEVYGDLANGASPR